MKKLFVIVTILTSAMLIALMILIHRYSNYRQFKEEVFAAKSYYFYDELSPFYIPLYSSTDQSILQDSLNCEAFLHNYEYDEVIKVEIKSAQLTNTVNYLNKQYYEYDLELQIKANDLQIIDCFLTLNYPDGKFSIRIGSLFYSRLPQESLKITNLYGLSCDIPYKTIAGICITIQNDSDSNYYFHSAMISDTINLGIISLDEPIMDATAIIDCFPYEYGDNYPFTECFISKQSTKSFLLLVNYEQKLLLSSFPLLLNINGNIYGVNYFNYLKIYDLDLVKEILVRGYYETV